MYLQDRLFSAMNTGRASHAAQTGFVNHYVDNCLAPQLPQEQIPISLSSFYSNWKSNCFINP